MARKRRSTRVAFNSKLVMDVGIAGILNKILPQVLTKFVPLDPTLYEVAGAGGTYLLGTFLKKPDMANAGIALGLVSLVAPLIEDLVGGITGTSPVVAPLGQIKPGTQIKQIASVPAMADYLNLNDYIPVPSTQSNTMYRDSY